MFSTIVPGGDRTWHVSGHRCLGDLEPAHKQLAVDSRCTPKEVLPGHPHNQSTDFARNPGAPSSPATTRLPISAVCRRLAILKSGVFIVSQIASRHPIVY